MNKSASKSEELFNRALDLIPGGVNSPVRAFNSVGGTPPFIERGENQWIWDVDGNRYMDFLSSWGPLILGHVNKQVEEATIKTMRKGFSFGAPTEVEVELAELVVDAVPSIDRVRFVNSGTEAVMSALRLARAYTGKNKIIKFDGCYHGHTDSMLVSAGSGMVSKPSSGGVPTSFLEHTISIPFNDKKAVEEIIHNSNDIACIILEPVPGNMGVILPKDGYLQFLRDITEKHNIILIFDEVISGFRLSLGGAQELFDITPDLTTLGKIIGGGFPVGAYGGKKKIMDMVAPLGDMYQAGTLSGNPVAMSAGIATLKQLKEKDFYKELNKKSQNFIKDLRAKTKDLPIKINSIGSMFTIFFTNKDVTDYNSALTTDTEMFKIYFHELLKKDYYISPSAFETGFISSVLTEEDLKKAARDIYEIIYENITLSR